MSTPGTLTIEDRVVEKIARQAVREVDRAVGLRRRVLGVAVGSHDESDDAQVSATVNGGSAQVALRIAVRWPAPVRTVTEDTRCHVRERIATLTGVGVTELDITVERLAAEPAPRRVR